MNQDHLAAPSDGEREASSAWWALLMGAAASIEDAANCLRDPDARKQAAGAAKHYRDAAQELWDARSAEIQQLREALAELLAKCEISDECQYGTLSTSFVAEIARAALKEPQQ